MLQRVTGCGLGVTEGDVLEVDGAVGHFHDGVLGVAQGGLLGQDLVGTLQGGTGQDQHDEDHGEHHQAAQDLGGVGEHGGQLAGGQAAGDGAVAGLDHHMGAQPGDDQDADVGGGLHEGAVEGQGLLSLAEVGVDGAGDLLELGDFLGLTDVGLDHTDAVEVLLDHVVQLIVGLEDTDEGGVDDLGDHHQAEAQQGQHDAVDDAQLGADGVGVGGGQDQHHGAADCDTDQHLESHLDGGDIGGQAGDDGRGGQTVDVGEVEGLDTVEHVVAQVPGEAGAGMGCRHGGGHAEGEAHQGVQHQDQAVTPDGVHVAQLHALVDDLGQDQGDLDLHVDLTDHAQGADDGGGEVLSDGFCESSYHG